MATRKRPRDVEEYDKYQGLVIYVGNVHYDANPVDFEHFLQDHGMSCTLYWPFAAQLWANENKGATLQGPRLPIAIAHKHLRSQQ
ncbi:hypothetical protein Forpi1262_v008619 [Fusarium oxysporum f. sp. raphani]|uniref:RRM domain-containing protein n=1 Tax=Fusarium oxysporum f. sp. raphani TaxID=96318 RepID=A0A8J5Q4G2_FUSOX|nr:hypothetical protein Forpi1262_v008619 [Fusarium oxysporum f. sp. raphani]